MRFSIRFLLTSVAAISLTAAAQSPTPIIVQAMPAVKAAPASVAPTAPAPADPVLLKLLAEIKADNDAQLAKQAATMQQVDELEKAVEQLKIYSKRG